MLPSRFDKSKALQDHNAKFQCDHAATQLRTRTIRGGGKQYVYQCTRCGEPTSNPVGKEKAIELGGGELPPAFDDELKEAWSRRRSEEVNAILKHDDSKFWDAYSAYLGSAEWAAKRKAVLTRANGLCEGCMRNPPSEVHHLTYEHVGDEFLFELVAVCSSCHDRLHPQQEEEKT